MNLQTRPAHPFLSQEQDQAGYDAYNPFHPFPLPELHAADKELLAFPSSEGSQGGGHRPFCYWLLWTIRHVIRGVLREGAACTFSQEEYPRFA